VSWLAHDLGELEKHGVPTVSLIATVFERNFNVSAKAFGVPGLSYAILTDHALGTMQTDEIHKAADAVIDILVEKLTVSSAAVEGPADGELTSLAKVIFGQSVPEREVFDGTDRLEAWEKMNAVYLDRGWSDGFPLVAPTPEAVARMLTGTRRPPSDVVAVLEPMYGIATVEKIAVNCVMAGCKPEQLPVLIAAVEAISDPRYYLRHVAMSTSPYTPMLVVNGPIAKRIGMNSGMAALGPGAPSAVNTVIGRALRLIMMNIGGNYVGITDMDTIGDPNKYSMCLAEREEESPWQPLHFERGFALSDSTVTAFVAQTSICHADHWNNEPVRLLERLGKSVAQVGVSSTMKWMGRPKKDMNSVDLRPEDVDEECLIVLCPSHARMLGNLGWSKAGVKEVIHQFARLRASDGGGNVGLATQTYAPGESARVRPEWGWLHDYPDLMVPAYRSPESFQIVVAGGDSIKNMVVLGGHKSITRKIET
jgi:hypothetical protein